MRSCIATDLSLLVVVGGMGIGRVTVTSEGAEPGAAVGVLSNWFRDHRD